MALDDHLRANQTTYSKEPALSEYYKRLDTKPRSPVKKVAEKVTELVKSDEDAPAKKQRRKTKSAEEEAYVLCRFCAARSPAPCAASPLFAALLLLPQSVIC